MFLRTFFQFLKIQFFSLFIAEGSVGCSPPEFKIVRPKKTTTTSTTTTTTPSTTTTNVDASTAGGAALGVGGGAGFVGTDLPVVSFETTQIYLPADFSTSDIQFVDNVAAIIPAASAKRSHEVDMEMAKLMERNPFWWQDGVQNTDSVTTTTLSPEELEEKRRRRRQRKERKQRRRRKHNKQHSEQNPDEVVETILERRRREIWNENYYQVDNYAEAFVDPSEVEQNIFNENDSRHENNNNEQNPNFIDEYFEADAPAEMSEKWMTINGHFRRHKRKSGKTTGALSRAKAGSSDSKSKSIDRHNKGRK